MKPLHKSLITLLDSIQEQILPLTDSGVHVQLGVDSGNLSINMMLTKYSILTSVWVDDDDDLENPQVLIDFCVNHFKSELPRIQSFIKSQSDHVCDMSDKS
jgi:hypothetical protein